MKKLIVVALIALAAPSYAAAKPGSPPLHREQVKYLRLYSAVRKQEGKRAPGRQILRYGVRRHGRVHPATAREVAASIRELRLLLHPLLIARPPAQPPAGVQTARAGSTLSRIAACESGGNPRAIGGGGAFRGKYQFTYSTWRSVGGSGDPAAAPEAEQDQRAAALYARSGSSPWPVCGR